MSQIKRLIDESVKGDCHVCGARNIPVNEYPTIKLKACIVCLIQIEEKIKEEKEVNNG